MKKCIFLFCLCFFVSSTVHAKTILDLTSGQKVEGDIIEETDDYIKINVLDIELTYYKDEIAEISETKKTEQNQETEILQEIEGILKNEEVKDVEEIIKTEDSLENKEIKELEESIKTKKNQEIDKSKELFKQEMESSATPSEVYLTLHDAINKGDWEEIKKYVTQEQINEIENSEDLKQTIAMLKDFKAKEIEVVREQVYNDEAIVIADGIIMGGRAKGMITLYKVDGEWKVDKEDWTGGGKILDEPEKPKATELKRGSISGKVVLPEVDFKGDLFIRFLQQGEMIQQNKDDKLYYVIKSNEVTSKEVPFSISNVPQGNYWGFATWDIADPFWEASWGEGNCPGYAGDYTGATKIEVTVNEEENTQVDINCTRYLKPVNPDDYGKNYEILDLEYRKKLHGGEPQLIVKIKNADEKPIQEINLKVNINGQEENFFVSGFGKILDPQEEKEFDIISTYKSYLWMSDKLKKELSLYELEIEITSPDNPLVYNKRINLDDVKVKIDPDTFLITFE